MWSPWAQESERSADACGPIVASQPLLEGDGRREEVARTAQGPGRQPPAVDTGKRHLHDAAPDARVILWVHTISTEMALQAMSLGIRGILRKTHPTETLIRCLTRVQEGDLWFEKELTDNFRSARRYSA